MGWVSGIVVFILIWWTVIFAVLPWGLRRDSRGMPENPRIKQKILVTTAISAILWLVVYGLIRAGVIDFRTLADLMMKQDYGA